MHRTVTVALFALLLAFAPMAGVVGATQPTTADAQAVDSAALDAADTASLAHPANVTIANQSSGGTTVVVDEVYVLDGGFVTIHDATVTEGGEDTFSSVLGTSAYLESGVHEDVTVTLDQPITNDSTLVAMPHRDTDGDRIYDFVSSNGQDDGPYVFMDEIVIDTASVTATATVNVTDQPSNGSSVVVDRTELSQGGFLAIHDASLLDGAVFDSVRGVSGYLSAGVHEDVRVQLDDPYTENGTVIPMPHLDTDGDQTYDFVTSEGMDDGPYTANGSAVVDTAALTVGGPSTATLADQVGGGNQVIVESAYLPEGGFVTVHDGNVSSDAIGSVRGTSAYLEPGLHRHIHVPIDDTVTADQPLVAMPHFDTNDNEQYDFVTSEGMADGPYTDDGNIVVDAGNYTVSAGVAIGDQESAGNTVNVHYADLSEGGFIAIHDNSLTAGAVLGSVRGTSSYLEAGLHEEVSVSLDSPLRTTQTVLAMPHLDTNDNEQYDFVTSEGMADGPYTADGNIVLDPGRISVLSQVTFEDQTTAGDSLTVQSATLHDGGFVTIHDSTLLDGAVLGSVRGTSEYLAPGTNTNVTIDVSPAIGTDGTFIAMPHFDTDGDRTYDFVTSEGADDGPYTADGAPVVVAANVTANGIATVDIQNQTSDGSSVTVASANLSKGGFVTAHDASVTEDALGSVRGTSTYLEPGAHEDVEITLDDPINETQAIIAMPHLDTDGDETYDFVTSEGMDDGPYTSAPADSLAGPIVVDAATVTVEAAEASVDIRNQTSTGNSVVVASASLSEGGFVTAHDATVTEDALGSVRGTSEYLAPGDHEDVTIALDDPRTESQAIIAMPHLDTNGNEEYDFVTSEGAEDGPYTNAPADSLAGPIVVDAATVTVQRASVSFEEQTTDGSSITVASVSMTQGGFVTAHDASLLDGATFDSVRGTSEYLEPGEHSDVTIEIEEPLSETGTVIAMPHLDTNGNEEYDFVTSEGGADGPYTNAPADSPAGPIVVAAAEVTVEMGDMDTETMEPTETMADDDQSTPDGSSGDGAGFGLVAALLAVVALALLARRD